MNAIASVSYNMFAEELRSVCNLILTTQGLYKIKDFLKSQTCSHAVIMSWQIPHLMSTEADNTDWIFTNIVRTFVVGS